MPRRAHEAAAGQATTCWEASLRGKLEDRLVIKDLWEYEERPKESLLVKEATEAGVKNIARYMSFTMSVIRLEAIKRYQREEPISTAATCDVRSCCV